MKKSKGLKAQIEVTKDGPYLVKGGLPLSEQSIVTNAEGESLDYAEGKKYRIFGEFSGWVRAEREGAFRVRTLGRA